MCLIHILLIFVETNDMEVPEQSNNTDDNEVGVSNSLNNQQNSTEYVTPSTRLRSQQQQQLLLVI